MGSVSPSAAPHHPPSVLGNVEHIIPIAILAEQCCIDECTIDHIAERFCCKSADCASKCYNIDEPIPATTAAKTTAAPIVQVKG